MIYTKEMLWVYSRNKRNKCKNVKKPVHLSSWYQCISVLSQHCYIECMISELNTCQLPKGASHCPRGGCSAGNVCNIMPICQTAVVGWSVTHTTRKARKYIIYIRIWFTLRMQRKCYKFILQLDEMQESDILVEKLAHLSSWCQCISVLSQHC